MKFEDLFKHSNQWMRGEGPDHRIIVSSRARLARNLAGFCYPGRAKKDERLRVLTLLTESFGKISDLGDAFVESMDNLSPLDKQILVERHLISREHAAKGAGSGVIINATETISIMINEEDHLRMQALGGGLQLQSLYKTIDRVDSELENMLDFDFSSKVGYLTACPTNVGTGLRASAMAHLPGLVLADQINQIIQAVNKLGLAVRGLYGEGTEALGNLFQISNQMTLGEREQDIVERLNKVIHQIIEHEENARAALLEKKPQMIYDQVGRAYGILTNAHIISSKEMLNLLSLITLGVDLELFREVDRAAIDELFIITQPAHMQRLLERKLTAEERDSYRAELVREKLKQLKKPQTH
jgi:protein arginine kinase